MKIGFVNQPFLRFAVPPRGSITAWIYEVARRLARSHDVTIFAQEFPGQSRDEVVEGVRFRRFWTAGDQWLDLLLQAASHTFLPTRPRFASIMYFPEYALKIALDLRREHYDIVHILNYSQFVPIIRALNPSMTIALHMQCEWLTQIDRRMVERRLRDTDVIVGCSDFITESIRRAFPAYADRCVTIYNGVDVEHFAPDGAVARPRQSDAKTLLFVGRVSPEKGVHVLIDAYRQVIGRFPDTRLELVGPVGTLPRDFLLALSDDPKVSRLEMLHPGGYSSHLLRRLMPEIASRVSLVGSLPQPELPAYYRRADVFVFPSVWNEPFGMPIVEAMACSVPAISTRGGGITEIVVEGKTGLLVERDDSVGLATAIEKLLSDDDLRERMGAAGRERAVECFSWERIAGDLARLYQLGVPASRSKHAGTATPPRLRTY